jgi:hypothetical protein
MMRAFNEGLPLPIGGMASQEVPEAAVMLR